MSVRGAFDSDAVRTLLLPQGDGLVWYSPQPLVKLTDDERLRIHLWIDLNVPF